MVSPPFACCSIFRSKSQLFQNTAVVIALLSAGYVCGTLNLLQAPLASAQLPDVLDSEEEVEEIDLSNEAIEQLQQSHESLTTAMELLRSEGKYNSATQLMNPYLVLSGGGDAIDDLERGIGVDPVTFAGIYAGDAVREVQDELSMDADGRYLYKNKLVRIYSQQKLKQQAAKMRSILETRVLP